MNAKPTPLESVRAQIDEIDAQLLRLVVARAAMPAKVAAAKAKEAAGAARGFGLRPAREAQVIRALLAQSGSPADAGLIVRIWRELIGDSLSKQGPYRLAAWGGRNPARVAELARQRFGVAPSLTMVDQPEAALQAAKTEGTVAILGLEPNSSWWGRLLAEPALKVFASLPCLTTWGRPSALAVAAVEIEPSGADQTLWVTDAQTPLGELDRVLGALGLAGELLLEAGGLRLFVLAGYLQGDDARLTGAPGYLAGVIGAAPLPFDL